MPETGIKRPDSLRAVTEDPEACRRISGVERPPESWYTQTEDALRTGRLAVVGALRRSSNNALLVKVGRYENLSAIYKPARFARPLWDFDKNSLHKREVAAYLVARAIGWSFVPPTVIRDGPQGEGAVQLCIRPTRASHYFEFCEDPRYYTELMRVCVFDVVINNADRKAGHCILDSEGRLWVLDHGTCFHSDDKLRTVIWEFSGARIPEEIIKDLMALSERLGDSSGSSLSKKLSFLLEKEELAALRKRIAHVLDERHFPEAGFDPPLPWPPI